MMGLRILDLLLPREIKFYAYLNEQADNFHEACKAFNQFLSSLKNLDEHGIHTTVGKIKEYELRGDQLERHIINELDQTFITPFDRDDIHSLVTNIDNSLDCINRLAHQIEYYKFKKLPAHVLRFATIIENISYELKRLIASLQDKKDVKIFLKKIRMLEHEGGQLFQTTMGELFSKKGDPFEMIKLKDVYENLEETINSIEHIAKEIRGIFVKQG